MSVIWGEIRRPEWRRRRNEERKKGGGEEEGEGEGEKKEEKEDLALDRRFAFLEEELILAGDVELLQGLALVVVDLPTGGG